MAIVTTARRVDFDIIHEGRGLRRFMDFVLTREDYQFAKPPRAVPDRPEAFRSHPAGDLGGRGLLQRADSAVAAGIDCAIVHHDFTQSHDFSQASYRIDTLIELKDIILTTA